MFLQFFYGVYARPIDCQINTPSSRRAGLGNLILHGESTSQLTGKRPAQSALKTLRPQQFNS